MSHVTWTPISRLKGQMSRLPGRFTHRGVNQPGSCSGDRENVGPIERGNLLLHCGLRAQSARRGEALQRPQREERGGGILCRHTAC